MEPSPIHYVQYDPPTLTEGEWQMLFTHWRLLFEERCPGEPPPDPQSDREFLLHPHPHWSDLRWMARADEKAVGTARLSFQNENSPDWKRERALSNLVIAVDPAFRRRGIGTVLLKLAVLGARDQGIVAFRDGVDLASGITFARHFGAKMVVDRTINRLWLDEANWKLVEEWRQKCPPQAPGVRIERIHVMPVELLEEYVSVYNEVGRQAPEYESGEYPLQEQTSIEDRRATEKLVEEKGITYTTMLSLEEDGAISGVTETYYNPAQPWRVVQAITGVLPPYRGRDLGKWLKAEMLVLVRREFPQAHYIETANANTNVPMLSINTRLGFRPYHSQMLAVQDVADLCQRFGL
ncbi:MAG: GNAT family N-acetyltransferase [Coprothermobacterota bacterium]|nr:GNAT family N-acetyltransferase [Coprothermobacterota bacterium]